MSASEGTTDMPFKRGHFRFLTISRHRAHGGAELRWNADTFAEMHRSIAVAACEE
jgi:hypothetical protein